MVVVVVILVVVTAVEMVADVDETRSNSAKL